MGMNTILLDEMKKLLSMPSALEVVSETAARAGAWRLWTFNRQAWYLRKHAGLTQAELSRRSGVSQHRISRIEAGEDVKLSTVCALWRALGYEPLLLPDTLNLTREPRLRRRGRATSLRNRKTLTRNTDNGASAA